MYKVSDDKGSSRRFTRSAFPDEDEKYGDEDISYSNDVNEYENYVNDNDYEYKDEYYAPNKEFNSKRKNHSPLAAINWRKMGNKIDRQFQLLGGLGGLFSGLFATGGPIAVSTYCHIIPISKPI